VDGSHSLRLTTSGEEELRRLVQMEEEETADEHEEGQCAESDVEVSPASVVSAVATCNTWCGDITRFECGITAMVWNQAPGDCHGISSCRGGHWVINVLNEAMSCPIGHQTDSIVRRLPDANGRNSRNSAPSTGRLPPTPTPRAA